MPGHRNFKDLRKQMSPKRRARNESRVKRELQRMLLAQLRRLSGMTQVQLAKALGVKQPTLSQLESQDDMQISTLRRIVEALGGELEIIAALPTGRVTLQASAEPRRRRTA